MYGLNYTAKVLQAPPKQKYNNKNGCRVITTGQPSKKKMLQRLKSYVHVRTVTSM